MRLVTASCDLEAYSEFTSQVGPSLIFPRGNTGFDTSIFKYGRASLKVPPFSEFLFDLGAGCAAQRWFLKMWFRAAADGIILKAEGFGTNTIARFDLVDGQIITWVGRSILGGYDPIQTGVFLDYDTWYELQFMVLHEKAFGIIDVFANGSGIRLTRQIRARSGKSKVCWNCPWGPVKTTMDMGPFGCTIEVDCPCDYYDDPCWDRMQTASGAVEEWFARAFVFGDVGSGGGPMWFDNVFINSGQYAANDMDNADHIPLGRRLTVLKPNGIGAITQFASGTGNPNWQNVDEVPVGVIDDNIAGSAGLTDLYEIENASGLII